MKDKILKLCRRLKKCTLDDFTEFIGVDGENLESLLKYLVNTGDLMENDGVYCLCQKVSKKGTIENKNFQFMTMFHSLETIDLIIRSFCLSLPTQKVACLVDVGDNCLCDFYKIFRNLIYERQEKELLNNYCITPQQARFRQFFDKIAYFYSYNNEIYVSKNILQAKHQKIFTDDEIQNFKKIYSYLSRIESHHKNETFMYQRLAEYIWRRNKSFEELYFDLKTNLLNIS